MNLVGLHQDSNPVAAAGAAADRSRVLIIQVDNWLGSPRLPEALSRAGFHVAVMSSPADYVAASRHVEKLYPLNPAPSRALLKSLRRAAAAIAPQLSALAAGAARPLVDRIVEPPAAQAMLIDALAGAISDWRPGLIIAGDEATRRLLQRIVTDADHGEATGFPPHLLEPIRFSLGAAAGFDAAVRKSLLLELAEAAGVRVPAHSRVRSAEQAIEFGARGPVVLKRDFLAGGEGVEICRSPAEIRSAMRRLRRLASSDRAARGAAFGRAAQDSGDGSEMTVERFIAGRDANFALVALGGRMLRGFAAEALQVIGPREPTSVTRLCRNDEMAAAARAVVARLGFTGFGGLDFILEEKTGEPFLLEFNPRPTPVCHLGGEVGADLCAALRAALEGRACAAASEARGEARIALFPQEWRRDRRSAWLRAVHHDVPWDDPALVSRLCGGRIPSALLRLRPAASGATGDDG
jgi:ATP-grasp domain